jgi:hypothetical protein
MSKKPVEERAHKQEVLAGTRDAYQTGYPHIDLQMGLDEAWKLAVELDPCLPSVHPKNLPESVKRALVGLARCVTELRYEWS